MLYATRFFAPDEFIFMEAGGKRSVVLSDLEIDRGRRDARVDEVIASSEIKGRMKLKAKGEPSFEEIAGAVPPGKAGAEGAGSVWVSGGDRAGGWSRRGCGLSR